LEVSNDWENLDAGTRFCFSIHWKLNEDTAANL
jgi:hypothetical protein